MNDWYIDRSKSFVETDLKKTMEIIHQIETEGKNTDASVITSRLKNAGVRGVSPSNAYAALTRFRDHGLIRLDNTVGNATKLYVDGKLDFGELLIDLFLKRPAKKDNSPNVKPFVLICRLFSYMMEMNLDPDDIFITKAECDEYLLPICDYSDLSYELVEQIVSERQYSMEDHVLIPRRDLDDNVAVKYGIWFNGLKSTPLFLPCDLKDVLLPNQKQFEFFKYVSENADELDATPTSSNSELYSYYCNDRYGFSEILPSLIRSNITLEEDDAKAIFEYLFGYNELPGFDYDHFFKHSCFGAYFAFIAVPKIAIKKIAEDNQTVADQLLNYLSNTGINYMDMFNNDAFLIQQEAPAVDTDSLDEQINLQREAFKKWMSLREYSANTIGHYVGALNAASKHYASAIYPVTSLFQIRSIEAFNTVEALIRNQDDFTSFNARQANGSLSAGMTQYRDFLLTPATKPVPKIEVAVIDESTRLEGAENVLYYGVPGCGKSHTIAQRCSDETHIERVVFHPDYTYSDFVGQILPRTDGTLISYPFVPGPFTRILKNSYDNPSEQWFLVVEEINRGNAPAIFGDIFQLLDRNRDAKKGKIGESQYSISNFDIAKWVYDDENRKVRLPSNLYILATMNTADQNVFTLDTAFKRRWLMKCIKNDISSAEHAQSPICGEAITWERFATVINAKIIELNETNLNGEDTRLGAYFVTPPELEDASIFAEKVLMYLWNDAFKYERDKVFKPEYKTLEDLIVGFEAVKFSVFKDSINF